MKLIINADDFGLSKSVTDGIIDGIKAGVITSTSIMANMEFADYAIKQAVKNDIKCVGLHINLTVGRPLTDCPSLCDGSGKFLYIDKQSVNNKADTKEIYNEIMAQANFVESRELELTHLDVHHPAIKNAPLFRSAIFRICREKNLPIRKKHSTETWRGETPKDIASADAFSEEFFGKDSCGGFLEALKDIFARYRNTERVVEIMSHAGYVDDYTKKITAYSQRETELETLMKFKKDGGFDGIEMISFKALKKF